MSAIMKNQKNGPNSPKMHHRAKLPITNPPKVWVFGSLNVDGNGKLVSAIMKNRKNGSKLPKMSPRAKLPITNTTNVWVSGFWCVDGNGKLVSAIMKNQKNGSNSPKIRPRAKQCQTHTYEPARVILTLLNISVIHYNSCRFRDI